MSVLVRNLITPATDHNHKLSEMTHLMSPGTLHHILSHPQHLNQDQEEEIIIIFCRQLLISL